jgi:hypothetical protein
VTTSDFHPRAATFGLLQLLCGDDPDAGHDAAHELLDGLDDDQQSEIGDALLEILEILQGHVRECVADNFLVEGLHVLAAHTVVETAMQHALMHGHEDLVAWAARLFAHNNAHQLLEHPHDFEEEEATLRELVDGAEPRCARCGSKEELHQVAVTEAGESLYACAGGCPDE